jgi:nicotinate-nucleotide adenylyltransferase
MRIGLFGGTFNPIHLGHIQVVHEVKEGFALDRTILIPSALPPHKEPGGVADAIDRMEMIRLAIADYPDLTASDVELKRSGPSYTIDTVRHFKSALPQDTALYLILGLDAFLEIDTWKSYMDLFLLVPFIIMARTGAGDNNTVLRWQTLENYLKSRISEGYQFSASRSCHVHNEKQPVFVHNVTPVDISSTKIRQLIKKGSTIRSLAPKIVEDFIKTKGLYL